MNKAIVVIHKTNKHRIMEINKIKPMRTLGLLAKTTIYLKLKEILIMEKLQLKIMLGILQF